MSRDIGPLLPLMSRVGATGDAWDFIRDVSNAYHELQAPTYDALHVGIRDREEPRLTAMIDSLPLAPRVDVLEIGCGTGFASSVVWRQLAPRISSLVCSDVSPHMLTMCRRNLTSDPRISFELADSSALAGQKRTYDLVLTCSVVHHVPDLERYFHDVGALVRPGGVYVMLHEPSSRYYRNGDCLSLFHAYRRMKVRKNASRYLRLGAYVQKVQRLLRGERSFATRDVNRLLLERRVIRSPLTDVEIGRLVDIHDPVVEPSALGLGVDGLDTEQIAAGPMRSFQLLQAQSYGFLGNNDDETAPQPWRDRARALATRFPKDGATLSALWLRI